MALAVIGPALDLVTGILKRVLPEKMSELDAAKLQQELTLELMKADWAGVAAQLDINKVEAGSQSVFVAGWRPAVGWVCAAAFGYSFVVQPFLAFILTASHVSLGPLPVLDMGSLMAVLGGILGLGGLRTFEKVKGQSSGH